MGYVRYVPPFDEALEAEIHRIWPKPDGTAFLAIDWFRLGAKFAKKQFVFTEPEANEG